MRSAARASAICDGEPLEDIWYGERPILGPNVAVQLHLEPGDAILASQKLPHRVSPNYSPHIRYMVYFRLSSVRHSPDDALEAGLWWNFDGLERVLHTGRDPTRGSACTP